jgi:hypothetical protein
MIKAAIVAAPATSNANATFGCVRTGLGNTLSTFYDPVPHPEFSKSCRTLLLRDLTSSLKLIPAAVRESFRAAGPERIFQMSQKRHSVDQIIAKLRRADVLLGKDTKVPEICKQLEIAEQT